MGAAVMANLITLLRIVAAFHVAMVVVHGPPALQWANAPLLVLMVALDGVDGLVARRRGETSRFGSVFDVMADRVTETLLWLTLAYVDLVPVSAAIVVLGRDMIVDAIRYPRMGKKNRGFDVMHSTLGRWLVAGRFMRAAYGTLKAITFALLLAMQPLAAIQPPWWSAVATWLMPAALVLVWLTVTMCLVRGVPVIYEWACILSRADRIRHNRAMHRHA
jgi:CDP-diacylglycerol---glycerol-3-phosphate 3-phosphatidyltransferase